MQLTGEYRIALPREQVWQALNDPEVLKASIPGCESLEQSGENGYAATVTARVGPVKARFQGQVTLSDLDPPHGYTISGEGKGGAAGFAKGGAKVTLDEDGDGTILRYEVDANVGGKLAQLGSRLIDGAARKLSDEFFGRFSEVAVRAAGPAPAAVAAPAAAAPPPPPEAAPAGEAAVPPPEAAPAPEPAEIDVGPPTPRARGLPTWLWVAGLVILVLLLLLAFGRS